MKVNDKHVIEELEKVVSVIRNAYNASTSNTCDDLLCKSIGKLDTLISILSVTKDD